MKKKFSFPILSGPLFFLFTLASHTSQAQTPRAEFSASTVSGCAPLGVAFKDLSTGNPKFWNWDFGNGQLSNLQNPVIGFSSPGKYTITLVVRNADGTNGITKTDYITVNPSPAANFSADITTGCVPATVHFTDASVAQGSPIISWKWDFGDGTSSDQQNPQKTYATPGFYGVSLTVVSNAGCRGVAGRGRYIRIVSGVKADFDYAVPATCRPPFNIGFSNLTSGPGKISYQWSFGNGNSSVQSDPVNIYNASGTYNIKLIAKSEFGCGDTIQKQAVINGTNTSIKSPDTVCLNTPVPFENISSPAALSSKWDFGNGVQSDKLKDTTQYSSPNTYKVKLISTYDNCTDSVLKDVVVQNVPVVNFTADKSISCKAPFTVNFQDNSPQATEWKWDFGDGSQGTGKTTSHTYNTEGKYNVTLTIKTKFGCENSLTKNDLINIIKPTVSIGGLPAGAGACANNSFTATANATAIDGVAFYSWDFGDGFTSTASSATHSYPGGDYIIKLSITTTGGCTATTTQAIKVGTPVTPSFTMSPNPVCPFSTVTFTGNATPLPAGLEWLWDFGDASTGTNQNTTHQYTDSKSFTVTLTAINHGCATSAAPQGITVKPPIPVFTYSIPLCTNPTVVDFNAGLSKVDNTDPAGVQYNWDFGPGAAPLTSTSPTPTGVTFPGPGKYPVRLTIINDGCRSTIQKDVAIIGEKADFVISSSSVCKNAPFTLSAVNIHKANFIRYDWTINGQTITSTDSTISTSLPNAGKYDITLTITDVNNCTNSKTIPGAVTVTGPKANFSLTNSKGCVNTKVIFTDLSTNNGPIHWTWDFGDGSPIDKTQNPVHAYTDTGRYTVKLTVTDNGGCQDALTLQDTVWTSAMAARFSSNYTTICPGIDIKFKDSSSGKRLHYLWDFGDGTTSTVKNPLHQYPAGPDKSYTVKLLIQDTTGCRDSASHSNYSVKSPKPSFSMKHSHSICPLLETQFTLTGKDYESVLWDFGDGSISTLPSPTHFYNAYGNYEATLHLIGYGGCEDSVKDSVYVYDPYATTHMTYSPLTACNSLIVDFSYTPTPHTFYTFFFGDGQTNTTGQTSFQHLYNNFGFFGPAVLLTDSIDCQVTVGGPSTIRVIGADAFFSPDKKAFCDTGTVFFTYYPFGNDPIVSSTWDLGDGTISRTPTEENIVHQYTKPGAYSVVRTVTTQAGCTKSEYDTVRIYRTPAPSILSDSVICINTPATIKGMLAVADTAIKWSWNLGNGATSALQNPSITYTKDGLYTLNVEAANKLSCKGTASKNIRVAPLPVINVAKDPVIPVGTGINLPVTYQPQIATYTWTPPKNLSCTDCATPFANPKFTTTYHIAVTDVYGCKSERDVTLTVVCNDKNYFIPNTFSPNHDGMNDVFYPRGSSITRVSGMRIFNRWGELVFERRNFNVNDPSAGWDGTFKGKPANPDTYVYVIEFICENAGIVPYQGNITLIR